MYRYCNHVSVPSCTTVNTLYAEKRIDQVVLQPQLTPTERFLLTTIFCILTPSEHIGRNRIRYRVKTNSERALPIRSNVMYCSSDEYFAVTILFRPMSEQAWQT